MRFWLSVASTVSGSLGVVIMDGEDREDAYCKAKRLGLMPPEADDVIGFPLDEDQYQNLPVGEFIPKAELGDNGHRVVVTRCPHGYPVAVRDA